MKFFLEDKGFGIICYNIHVRNTVHQSVYRFGNVSQMIISLIAYIAIHDDTININCINDFVASWIKKPNKGHSLNKGQWR